MKRLRITILMDNPRSWFVPHGKKLVEQLEKMGHTVTWVERPEDIPEGDIAFFLSVENIVKESFRKRNAHNIVVHGSKVPIGKGWSPLTWQILEGHNEITVSLFEAVDKVDSGDVYEQIKVEFDGSELIDELREKEANAISNLVLSYVESYPAVGKKQEGPETFYRRRTPEDSELDVKKSVEENFDLLRVVDNDRYPAFFKLRGHTYVLKIYKKD